VLRKLTTGPYGELWSSTFVSRRRHAEWMKFFRFTNQFSQSRMTPFRFG